MTLIVRVSDIQSEPIKLFLRRKVLNKFLSGLSEFLSFFWMEDKISHCLNKSCFVPVWNKNTGFPLNNRFINSWHVSGNNRQAITRCFEKNDAETLTVNRIIDNRH